MSLRAVAFDLFGTLVNEFPRADFYATVRRMARELSADEEEFEREWTATAIDRQTGRFATVEDNVLAICRRLGVQARSPELERALAHRQGMYTTHFRPRSGARETLERVKMRGYPVALVSMCAPDTPALWRASVLAAFVDVEVFSSEVGLRKPDPEIFLLACERLDVEPAACLYVGDGAYGEMAGAAAVGMHSVLVRDPDEAPGSALRPESQDWDGHAIGHLSEVLGLLDPV